MSAIVFTVMFVGVGSGYLYHVYSRDESWGEPAAQKAKIGPKTTHEDESDN